MTPKGLAARRTCVVVAHDHMRQRAHASILARFSMVCTIYDRSINQRCPEGRFATGRCGQRPLRGRCRVGLYRSRTRHTSPFATKGGCASRAVTTHPRRYAHVGASIARPRYNPPQLQHADANSYPIGLRICIGVVLSLAPAADERCSPLHTDSHPSGGRCSYGCTHVQNFLKTPIRFFLRLSAISRSSDVPCQNPNKTKTPGSSEPRVIQKG